MSASQSGAMDYDFKVRTSNERTKVEVFAMSGE